MSTSSSSDAAWATRTVAPADAARETWRANESGPNAGASTSGGVSSSAFVPVPWRSGTITTPASRAPASSAATSPGSSDGQSPGTSSVRPAPRPTAAAMPSAAASD